MTKKTSQELTNELFEMVQDIKLNDVTAIFGTTSNESILQTLRKSVVEFAANLSSKATYDEVMHHYEALVASIDTAGITGLISEDELSGYYKLVDDIWAALEKENK